MASTTLNITDTITPFDEVDESVSPVRTTENVEDTVNVTEAITEVTTQRTFNISETINVSETLTETHTERTVKNVDDQIAVHEVLIATKQNIFIFDVEENIGVSESINEAHTIRTVHSVAESIGVSDVTVTTSTDRVDKGVADSIIITDDVNVNSTDRFGSSPDESINISDIVIQEFGIKIEDPISGGGEGFIDGLSLGSFQAGAEATLSINLNPNVIFHRWDFSKSGITNIYDPNSTIVIPSGGGSITPILFNLGAIIVPFNSVILITDPNTYKYVEDANGDFISTTEETIFAGDAVTVATSNITIEQGSTFQKIVTYKNVNGDPVNLTGYTAEMQIRKTKESSTIIQTLSTSNGLLILGGESGTITMNIPGATTDLLDFVWGRYDLELYPGGDTNLAVRLLEGKVNLSKQVTQ